MTVSAPAIPAKTAGFFTRPVLAGVVGNAMEWYDFMVYGYFASTIGRLFFPSDDPFASMVAAYGVLAVSFVMRPVGAIMFAYVGDRLGRKRALELSVLLMAIPTFLLGLLPSHATLGNAAPVLLTLLRLAQGLSVGGEYTSSFSFVIEHAPHGRRGLHGSLTNCGAIIGILLASLSALATEQLSGGPDGANADWAWRIPFVLGVLVASVALWVRRSLPETPAFENLKARGELARHPVAEALRHDFRGILHVFCLYALPAAMFYVLFLFVQAQLIQAGMPASSARLSTSLSLALLCVALPCAGALSDRLGRRPVMLSGALCTLVCAVPLYSLLLTGQLVRVIAGQLGLTLIIALLMGPIPATLVERFAPRTRFSALSLGYNGCLAVFGGTSPMLAGLLIRETGHAASPAYYLMLLAIVSGAAVLLSRETYQTPLN
jgi:MHS family proline/betaine transporter-like MFS transporter